MRTIYFYDLDRDKINKMVKEERTYRFNNMNFYLWKDFLETFYKDRKKESKNC